MELGSYSLFLQEQIKDIIISKFQLQVQVVQVDSGSDVGRRAGDHLVC